MATLSGTRTRRPLFGWIVLVVVGIYLLLPLLAMVEFSTRGIGASRSLESWAGIGEDSDLIDGILASLQLALLTVVGMLVLLVPTMVWVQLRVPSMRRVVEFICLLPLTIPAIVLVVGIAPIYAWITYLLGDSPVTLTFVYIILALPFSYRAIDAGLGAIDVVTLSEAARSLGSSWGQVLVGVIIPNIRGALLSAAVLAVALVLGEFTIASLLNFDTLQVVINLLGKRNAGTAVAASVAALLFGFVLLLVLSYVEPRRRAAPEAEELDPQQEPERIDP
jgi:putative spermidine/putrescine transport system permease protein